MLILIKLQLLTQRRQLGGFDLARRQLVAGSRVGRGLLLQRTQGLRGSVNAAVQCGQVGARRVQCRLVERWDFRLPALGLLAAPLFACGGLPRSLGLGRLRLGKFCAAGEASAQNGLFLGDERGGARFRRP
ncbi:hypothetical protein G6F59_014780 [Rhizopus arrhizus]|nr:hypothetical protein G6F59_014780 [Rhizopus arrhizus]